jgi:hypothetical protein
LNHFESLTPSLTLNTCTGGTGVWEYNGKLHDHTWGETTLDEYIKLEASGERVVHQIIQYMCPD